MTEQTNEQKGELKRFGDFKEDKRPQRNWWAPGEYINYCRICGDGFIGDKRAGHCADCAYKLPDEPTNTRTPATSTDQATVELVKQALAAMSYHRDLDQRLHDLHRNCRCMICRAIQAAEEWLKGKI